MLDDWNSAVLGDKANQTFASTGYDAVYLLVKSEQMIESLSVYGGNELHGFLGYRGPGQGLFDDGGEGTIGMKSFLASARIDALPDFRQSPAQSIVTLAGFVNDPDDPDGGSDLSDVQSVGPILFLDDLANGIGKPSVDAIPDHAVDPFMGQTKTVHHGFAQSVFLGRIDILLVFFEQKLSVGLESAGYGLQRPVLVGSAGGGQFREARLAFLAKSSIRLGMSTLMKQT